MGKQKLLNYVVNSHVRNELEINELLRLIHLLPDDPELNENQQIVLEWLKDRTTVSSITSVLWLLLDDALEVDYDTDGSEAWNRLPIDQKFQVLAAFAEWGTSNEKSD